MSSFGLKIVRSFILFYVLLGAYGWFFADASVFFPPTPGYIETVDVVFIGHGDQQKIAAFYYKNSAAKYTILYNHGNASDIGYLKPLLKDFFKAGYSILAYDYSGYGLSTGQSSEQQAYKDIAIAYDYLVNQLATRPEHIIVYGHSLGAAIATELATQKPVAAVVLESPFVSAFRVRTVWPLYPFDKFSNIKKISSINAPVYIMHSRDDPIIAFWHSELLYETAVKPKTYYWLDDAGHNGAPYSGKEYWNRLASFAQSLERK